MTEIPTLELDERFRAAAAAEGLLDVAYDVLDDIAIGPLLVGVTDRGLCRISFDPDPEQELEVLARLYGPRVLRSPRPVDRVRRELEEYLDGRRRSHGPRLDDADGPPRRAMDRGARAGSCRRPRGRRPALGQVATHAGVRHRFACLTPDD